MSAGQPSASARGGTRQLRLIEAYSYFPRRGQLRLVDSFIRKEGRAHLFFATPPPGGCMQGGKMCWLG
eukprot:1149688-Pelagomonas_calceolata.AAC.2